MKRPRYGKWQWLITAEVKGEYMGINPKNGQTDGNSQTKGPSLQTDCLEARGLELVCDTCMFRT